MLIAEALALRADLEMRQARVSKRIMSALLVQEGNEPQEDLNTLLQIYASESEELYRLIAAINHTNEVNKISTDRGLVTMNQALARREHLSNMRTSLRDLAYSIDPTYHDHATEFYNVAVLDAAQLQNEADIISRDLQRLVMMLQKSSWATILQEYIPSSTQMADTYTTS